MIPPTPTIPVGERSIDADGNVYQEHVEDTGARWVCCTRIDGSQSWRRRTERYTIEATTPNARAIVRRFGDAVVDTAPGDLVSRVYVELAVDRIELEREVRRVIGDSAWCEISDDDGI